MRNFKEILNDIHEQAIKDGCQSWNVICLMSMEQAIKEYKMGLIKDFQNLIDNCEETTDNYIIKKSILNEYIEKIEILNF